MDVSPLAVPLLGKPPQNAPVAHDFSKEAGRDTSLSGRPMAASLKPGAGNLSSEQSISSSGTMLLEDSVSLELQPVSLELAIASTLNSVSDIAEVGLTVDPLELTGLCDPSDNGGVRKHSAWHLLSKAGLVGDPMSIGRDRVRL